MSTNNPPEFLYETNSNVMRTTEKGSQLPTPTGTTNPKEHMEAGKRLPCIHLWIFSQPPSSYICFLDKETETQRFHGYQVMGLGPEVEQAGSEAVGMACHQLLLQLGHGNSVLEQSLHISFQMFLFLIPGVAKVPKHYCSHC